jgi:hypothetical protein
MEMSAMKYKRVDVDGFGVAYRGGACGRTSAAVIAWFPDLESHVS